ncbi:MAG: hypothetical protein JSW26_00615 [Desulfobacterales bacterium]|nr:MAG: hypothetical protein JSW26_00615 [Desulfobacterales bacterium]
MVSAAAKGPVAFNVDIPPETRKAVRLRNLPRDAMVDVAVVSSGEIVVAIVNSAGYKSYPTGSRPLFLGQVDDHLTFSIIIPATDHYYLVLQNRSPIDSRSVTIMIRAARGEEAVQLEAADRILEGFERQLHQLFVFDPLPIEVKRCGTHQMFGSPPGIVLCAESAQGLYSILGEKTLAGNTMGFAIFHIVASELLDQWRPSRDPEEQEAKADEMATVFSLMLNREDQLKSVATYLVENPTVTDAMTKFFDNDPHLFTVARAKTVLRRLDDLDLVLRWQKVLVPHMQTAVLQKLQQHPTARTDVSMVEKELANRR